MLQTQWYLILHFHKTKSKAKGMIFFFLRGGVVVEIQAPTMPAEALIRG